jgi:hypothetical protein
MVNHQQKDGDLDWNRIICIVPLWFDDHGGLHVKATGKVPVPVPKAAG